MPRTARLVIPEVSLHVVHRGHDRAACFFGDADYLAYLVSLATYGARFRCAIHAYCLMTNHVHLLLTPLESQACAQLMKHLAQRHSKRINAMHGRTGTLWEGRFYSAIVPSERYALACYRYIDMNPVRAGVVARPDEYRWSSYRANVQIRTDGWLSPHPAYLGLAEKVVERGTAYRSLCDASVDAEVIDEIRKATRSGQRMGAPRKPRGRRKQENSDCHQLEMVTVTN